MLWDISSVSGLTVTTMTVSPTKREPPFGAGTPGGGFLFLGMVNLTFGIPDLSIPDSPQKSSAVQKVYRARLISKARLSTTSQSHSVRQGRVAAPSVCFAAARILLAAAPTAPPCFRHWRRSSPLPLVGEPLAKPFTLRGLPKPPLDRGGGTA